MPTTCCVPNCTSRYKENISFFHVPKDKELFQLWGKIINRNDLKAYHRVCEKHFSASDIIWEKKLFLPDGKLLTVVKYKKPTLREKALPRLDLIASERGQQNSYSESPVDTSAPVESFDTNLYDVHETFNNDANVSSSDIKNDGSIFSFNEKALPRLDLIVSEGDQQYSYLQSPVDTLAPVESFDTNLYDVHDTFNNDANVSSSDIKNEGNIFSFNQILNFSLSLPSNWTKTNYNYEKMSIVVFSKTVFQNIHGSLGTIAEKEVIINQNLELHINVYHRLVQIDLLKIDKLVKSEAELQNILFLIESLNVCRGCSVSPELQKLKSEVTFLDCINTLRHKYCHLLINSIQCRSCFQGKRTLARKQLRQKNRSEAKKVRVELPTKIKEHIQAKNKKLKNTERKNKRLKIANMALKKQLLDHKKKVLDIKKETLEQLLKNNNLPKHHQSVIWEIFQASKRRNKGKRYGENWLMLCILLRMRSPKTYDFIRNNNILPLPSVTTIRRNIRKIKPKCGFDPQFFKIFAEFLSTKSDIQKHGVLVFDEISTRESIAVNSQTLSYDGLIDFGEENESQPTLNEKANHGLVFMFKPLFDDYAQAVAVFASRGPVKSDMLAKLILKCIILLEQAGATVHGIVSDGASTNRSCWTQLGASGKRVDLKNYFTLPSEPCRKIYIFSDPPHLIKNVRNRLFNNGSLQLDPKEEPIKWEHFQILFDVDGKIPGSFRVCPKLTQHHLNLNSSSKMRVKLAVQIFSKSVADGLCFYRDRKVPGLEKCEGTIQFCLFMNSLFDALNERRKGIKVGDAHFKVLQNALKVIDEWEKKIDNKTLDSSAYLTRETAEGLRMTVKSTIDIITDFSQKGLPNILTGAINQDALEQFFGTVRATGGCNDHPSTPTFLQIYRILTLYSILKPPKTGNCTILETPKPLISLSNLKEISASSHCDTSKIELLKKRLYEAVRIEDWNVENIVMDHDYTHPEYDPIEFVLYYVTEYICQKILKATDCDICLNSIQSGEYSMHNSPVNLIQLKRSHFIHPHTKIFNIVCALEKIFIEKVESPRCSPFIYEEVLSSVIDSNMLSFPCEKHGHELISSIVTYYVRLRIYKYANQCNNNKAKENQFKKKFAKFTTN